MLSVKLSGNTLHVKIESHLGGNQYKGLMNLFNSIEGAFHWEQEYTWILPKASVDLLVDYMGEDNIAWYNSLEEIKGVRENIIPDFQVSDYGLSDLKLTPYPFQAVGISFLHDIQAGILGDEMGLGS